MICHWDLEFADGLNLPRGECVGGKHTASTHSAPLRVSIDDLLAQLHLSCFSKVNAKINAYQFITACKQTLKMQLEPAQMEVCLQARSCSH